MRKKSNSDLGHSGLALLIALIFFHAKCGASFATTQDGYKYIDIDLVENVDVKIIEKGVDSWRRSLNFVCDFEYSSGFAANHFDAKKGEWFGSGQLGDKKFDPIEASGTIVKLENSLRFRAIFDRGSDVDPETGHTTFFSRDVTQTDKVVLTYDPPQKSIHFDSDQLTKPKVIFNKYEHGEGHLRKILMEHPPIHIPNSFFQAGGNDGFVISNIDVRRKIGESVEFSVSRSESTIRVVVSVKGAVDGVRESYTFHFNDNSTIPCLSFFHFDSRDGDGKLILEEYRYFSNFVDCGMGNLVAKKFVEVVGPLKIQNGDDKPKDLYVGRHWNSMDLGNRKPVIGDFDVQVDSDAEWKRYPTPIPNNGLTINPLKIDHAMILKSDGKNIDDNNDLFNKKNENNAPYEGSSMGLYGAATIRIVVFVLSCFLIGCGWRIYKWKS